MGSPKPAKRVRLERHSPFYWGITFEHPRLNLFGLRSIPQPNEIVTALESDDRVRVVVFDSAVESSFITHYDFRAKLEDSTNILSSATGLPALPDLLVRIRRARVVPIAAICGRATGVGSGVALARDTRFASPEGAILVPWEVRAGLVPGGGPMARLPQLIGRGRALDVLFSADDIRGDVAELYGYVNRALAGPEPDAFIDALATRIACFDKAAIADTKRLGGGRHIGTGMIIDSKGERQLSFRLPGRYRRSRVAAVQLRLGRDLWKKPLIR